ncbi:MAG TPA: hypothetical protein VLA12_16300, partial [Planctomycetaceae bacterium]|nr:hypothetical protein [Planctomycetaceae bacterium]
MGHHRHKHISRLLRGFGPLVLFTLLALGSTRPLLFYATTKLPIGTSCTVTVPFFNSWTLWWNADRASNGFENYWDAPIFFPAKDTFAFSEPQPMTLAVAPVIWLTDSRTLAYNLYLWISLVLNGLMTYRLLRAIPLGRLSAAVGGATMMLLPIIHWQVDVLQLVPLWGILWVWSAFLGIARKPSLPRGMELGIAFTATFYCSIHHALLLSLLMVGSAWLVADRWRDLRMRRSLGLSVMIAGGLTAPFAWHIHHVMTNHQFERTEEQIKKLAARPVDYLIPHGQVWFDWNIPGARDHWPLGTGRAVSLLALVGTIFGLRRRKWRRGTLFFVMISSLGFILSLGLQLRVGSWQPWQTLCDIVPGLSQVRNVFRFAYFVQMSLVILAAQGFYALWIWKSVRLGRTRGKRTFLLAYTLLAMFVVFEVRPHPVVLAEYPDVREHEDWINFIREETPPHSAIACLPFAPGNLVQD